MFRTITTLAILCGFLFGQGKHWVFFVDKGLCSSSDSATAIAAFYSALPQRTIERRAKVLPPDEIVSWRDLPVCERYISEIIKLGAKVVHRTRWFNAVSVIADSSVLSTIANLSFVRYVRPVATFKRNSVSSVDEGDYGLAAAQLRAVNAPPLHKIGADGSGVLVCITDTGFNSEHTAFAGADIVAQWDFVGGDSIVDYDAEDDSIWIGIPSHGSLCWSILGGFVNGSFSGVAPGASFILARTENIANETPIEEDNWVAAMEWADSIGADVISTSLGYSDWYEYEDMDGDTPIISAGADMAVYLGIAVLVAAGNSGSLGYGSLTAPGDADSVITVGACDNSGAVSGFSSRGPTYDGRTKPDILAPGQSVYGADGMSDSLFRTASGTSTATPMAAGSAALLLELRPSTTPMQLLHIFKMTAEYATSPNNDHGWGLIDARAAAAYPVNDTAILILSQGWNLMAIPADTVVSTDALPIIEPAYMFNGTTYIATDSLVPGKGYFVLCANDTFAIICGSPLTELDVHLQQGWNLIGGLARRTYIEEYLDVFWCPFLFGYVGDGSGYFLTKNIAPGQGVWILSNAPRSFTLTE